MSRNEDGSDAPSPPIATHKRVEQVVKSTDNVVLTEPLEVLSNHSKGNGAVSVVNSPTTAESSLEPDLTSTGLVGWWTFEDGGVVSTAAECKRGQKRKDTRKWPIDGSKQGVKTPQLDPLIRNRSRSPVSLHHVKHRMDGVEIDMTDEGVTPLGVRGDVPIDRSESRTPQVSRTGTSASSHPSAAAITGNDQDLPAERKTTGDLKKSRVVDVTEHRFPSLIRRHVSPLPFLPPSVDPTLFLPTPPTPPIHPVDKPLDTSIKSDTAVLESACKTVSDRDIEGDRTFLRNILTINSSTAIEKWNKMGGIGIPWQWLDAEYLSSLSHLSTLSLSSAKNTGVTSPQSKNTKKGTQPETSTNAFPLLLSALPKVPVPLPSYCEDNQCPFELRKCKLAQLGRDLQFEVICPQGRYGMISRCVFIADPL